MRIAFYVYPTAFQSPGGGEVLLLKTKEYLEREGAQVKLLDPWHDKLDDFDILHTFGSVKDSLPMMEVASRRGVKNVLSSICFYDWQASWGTYSDCKLRSMSVLRHIAKTAVPWVPSKRKRMMSVADIVIPNSEIEAKQLKRYFSVPDSKIEIVYNAVDSVFADATADLFHEQYPHRDFVLCVGRIEPRKNQLNVIKALKGLEKPVVFIGDYVYAYRDYYEACRREADSNMHFLDGIRHDSDLLKSAYAACDTFLLATWLETPGLAALEAGIAGAKVIVTSIGAAPEYFNDLVEYVRPNQLDDIRKTTLRVLEEDKSSRLSEHIKKNFTWEITAQANLKVYEKVLAN